MKGSVCKCGFKTISLDIPCPRCGKTMSPQEFPDSGRVLSYVKLGIPPEKRIRPMDLVMVEILDGPKIVCWTNSEITKDQVVRIKMEDGIFLCEPF
ncbi:MAG: hypothetical protein QW505_02010 [Thermoplasmata archaeon]